ncbi:LPXTG cell wall anchor domain-containing protein [Lentilactobacillus kisonensis]|uniref:LPXTG cell wall anchor domain-containing protein n=1 Tax=Lentilactobacillus kisonensis TaxID=481722 RepID=UPI0006D0420D|nr:LPXTG cell wall anchor domain-containing protein [Lentilactobacillus kisonensis]
MPIEQPFGNKGSVLTSTDQSKSQPKSSDLSQLPNGVIGKQPADILNETVYLSGVDNHGNQLFSRSTTVSTTELPNLLANNVDYYGYKWQRSTYDDKRHMITHHYVPERASFKVIHLDNAGHQISSKQINAEFGSMVTIAPRTIKGYHCLDKSRTIKLVSMFPEDVQFHYRRDNFEDKSSRVSQAKAQPKQSEAIRSKHVSDSKLASHSRLADKQDSRKHLPQTGDTTFKAGPLIGILMLLGLISLKVIKHRP